jgi:gliding motility-associated-like protein
VRIDYRQALFVPTAFTPNNDGNNDVFGVVNLSVQKIIEFRVFNRWGQEIFSTTDARQGWDGTWKATPQPTGSYNYIIRVAYPDGITDTFKGEVTLIR